MKKNIRTAILFVITLFTIMMVFPTFPVVFGEDNTPPKQDNPTVPKFSPTFLDWYQQPLDISITKLNHTKIPREVKGLYVTGNTAESKRFDHLVDLLNKTELNSFVIDVKEDSGYITFHANIPEVREINSDRKTYIKDIDKLLKETKDNHIYTIARIVTFKDPFFAGAKPEIAMKRKTGGVWRDNKGVSWVDPYNKLVWDYNIAIAKEAAEKGFNEIQFDYVRFPENGAKVDREVAFNNPENKTKAQNIADFLAYAKENLKDYPVYISADVFGLTTSVKDDMGIGQQWKLISSIVDYISPMMYPSHYANRTYGIPVPDADPYHLIKSGLRDALNKNQKIQQEGKSAAIIRPWYQDFTATWVSGHIPYGANEVDDQIKAGNESGVHQYLMWDPWNKYSEKAWLK